MKMAHWVLLMVALSVTCSAGQDALAATQPPPPPQGGSLTPLEKEFLNKEFQKLLQGPQPPQGGSLTPLEKEFLDQQFQKLLIDWALQQLLELLGQLLDPLGLQGWLQFLSPPPPEAPASCGMDDPPPTIEDVLKGIIDFSEGNLEESLQAVLLVLAWVREILGIP